MAFRFDTRDEVNDQRPGVALPGTPAGLNAGSPATPYGPQGPPPPAPAPPPIPTYNWDGSLDAQGADETADATRAYSGAVAGAESEYNQGYAQTVADEADSAYQRDQDYLNNDRQAAGRGVFRSGIRQEGADKALSAFGKRATAIKNARNMLINNKQKALNAAAAERDKIITQARYGAAARSYQRYRDTYFPSG